MFGLQGKTQGELASPKEKELRRDSNQEPSWCELTVGLPSRSWQPPRRHGERWAADLQTSRTVRGSRSAPGGVSGWTQRARPGRTSALLVPKVSAYFLTLFELQPLPCCIDSHSLHPDWCPATGPTDWLLVTRPAQKPDFKCRYWLHSPSITLSFRESWVTENCLAKTPTTVNGFPLWAHC